MNLKEGGKKTQKQIKQNVQMQPSQTIKHILVFNRIVDFLFFFFFFAAHNMF